MYLEEHILHRHPENPILKPSDFPDANGVYNCGQTMYNGKTLLLVPVVPREGLPVMHVATSNDGVHFDVEPEPFITPTEKEDWKAYDKWAIDPRVTKIEETYYIVCPLAPPLAPNAILEKTVDWKKREFVECIALPCNRVPSLFPERIDGLYYRLDRPYAMGAANEKGEIWLSSSPDLINWGRHRRIVDVPYSDVWAASKIGPTPPIKTDAGWLVIIHGVIIYAGGRRYSLGAILLDLKKPKKMLGRTKGWILTPNAPYEYMGNSMNTVFACGAIADYDRDRIRLYYGAADTCICLATGRLSELVDACLNYK